MDIILSWSGGKDSALALHNLQMRDDVRVVGLLTTMTSGYERVSMHGVRRELLEAQAEALGLPLYPVYLSQHSSNDEYAAKMEAAMRDLRDRGLRTVAFGDIFLEDVRAYREANLATVEMRALFPLWGRDSVTLARQFIDLGFRAIVTCVDTEQLDGAFAGRFIDAAFLRDLPDSADPCGENGEFHSFVIDGPVFREPLDIVTGERVLRDERFLFCDIKPLTPPPSGATLSLL